MNFPLRDLSASATTSRPAPLCKSVHRTLDLAPQEVGWNFEQPVHHFFYDDSNPQHPSMVAGWFVVKRRQNLHFARS